MDSELKTLVAQTEAAMAALEEQLPNAMARCPDQVRTRLNNALLNIAVNRIVALEGAAATAALLWRLSDALAGGQRSTARASAFDLSRLDG